MAHRTPGADLADLEFVENWPTDDSAEALLDELLFQRAVQSYLWALPAMNTVAMKEAVTRRLVPATTSCRRGASA